MIRDVSTRWNSTAELIQRALELAPALKILIVKAEYNKPGRGVQLKRFQLSPEEWNLMAELSPLLEVSFLRKLVIALLNSLKQDLPFGNKGNFEEQDTSDPPSDPYFRHHHHGT
jgi:hypothetical protein